jgi:uncharacterized membrane protein YqiK
VPIELLVPMIVAMVVMIGVVALVASRAKVRVPPGGALVIYGAGREPRVTFTDALVLPIVARAEPVDCSSRTIAVVREGADALRCHDNLKVDIRAEFRMAVNATADDVLQVMRSVGARAADAEVLRDLFEAKLADAIATVVRMLTFDQVSRSRDELRDQVMQVIGTDLGGWVLQDLAFVRIEQVPLEQLDPNNIHDAQAISLIQERVTNEQRRTNEMRLLMQREAAERQIAERQLQLEVERATR